MPDVQDVPARTGAPAAAHDIRSQHVRRREQHHGVHVALCARHPAPLTACHETAQRLRLAAARAAAHQATASALLASGSTQTFGRGCLVCQTIRINDNMSVMYMIPSGYMRCCQHAWCMQRPTCTGRLGPSAARAAEMSVAQSRPTTSALQRPIRSSLPVPAGSRVLSNQRYRGQARQIRAASAHWLQLLRPCRMSHCAQAVTLPRLLSVL